MSDNGGLASNLPLKGQKGQLYEGGIREPMIIKWPSVTKSGSVCAEPVTSTDFYPTMLEMAGLEMRPQQHVDGVSLVPLLKGEKSLGREAIYWHYPHYCPQGNTPASAIRDGDWKLIKRYETDQLELYNLRHDIGEKTNLAGKKPEHAKKLLEKLNRWLEETDAKFPSLNPNAKTVKAP